jgi:hypothetical protein
MYYRIRYRRKSAEWMNEPFFFSFPSKNRSEVVWQIDTYEYPHTHTQKNNIDTYWWASDSRRTHLVGQIKERKKIFLWHLFLRVFWIPYEDGWKKYVFPTGFWLLDFFFFPSWHLSLYTWHKRKTLVTQREREEEDGSKWRGLCGLFYVGGSSSGDPPKRKNSPHHLGYFRIRTGGK